MSGHSLPGPNQKASISKLTGYYEYDVDGNKQQISTERFNELSNSGVGQVNTAGVAGATGQAGTIVADQSHGKAIIDESASSDIAQSTPQYKEAVEVGNKQRGQRGTHKTTTRYIADTKNQDKFDANAARTTEANKKAVTNKKMKFGRTKK